MNKSIRIIGRFDKYSGIGKHGWSFVNALRAIEHDLKIEAILTDEKFDKEATKLLHNKNISISSLKNIIGKSDIAILCDILTQVDDDYYQLGNINALFFVWDSTLIPGYLRDIINTKFDLVIVPTEFVKQALLNSGIDKDILVLPLVVDAPPILPSTPKSRFTFGFIGSYEERKNVKQLIEVFLKTFGNSADLRIHLTYSHMPAEDLENLCIKHMNSNVKITTGELKQEDFAVVLNEIDCFISLSMGEGYSFIPREYMHLERPIILSDSSAHQSIPKMDGIWFIDAKIPYPAIYPQIDGKQHGLFYASYMDDIVFALENTWKEVKQKKRYPSLSNYAKSFNAKALSEYYHGIISPTMIIKSSFTSHISPGLCLTLKNDSLVEKYGKHLLKNPPINKHVVLANDGGFFSVFNRYVSILAHELEEDPQSIIIPDWRISSMVEYLGHSHFTSFCYGTFDDGNIFLKIFEPPFNIPIEDYNSNKYLRDNAILRTDYNSIKEPDLTYIYAYKLYKRKDFQDWREMYHKHFSKHIKLRHELKQKINNYISKYFDGYYIISAHIRHPSHSMEQPNGRIPTVEVFKEHIDYQLQKASQKQDKPVRLFIASDQNSVIDYFLKHYPDILITTHATRTTKSHDLKFHSLDKVHQQKEGFQIQHITASDKNKWSVKMADEVIIDAWLLAQSDVFIHITSNIATAVSFINPKVSMVYCK